MTDTAHLGLPLIEASQAQKHVTHNEAIVALDAIVQLSVKDSTHTVPPAAIEGDRYKVASGATGVWTSWDLNIALYTQGQWQKLVPQLGWICFDEASGAIAVWQGAPNYWVDIGAAGGYVSGVGETNIASAATCDIGSAPTTKVQITGTTPIASFGTVRNKLRLIRFAGAVKLTYDAVSLVLPGKADIVTATDDIALAASDGSGNWRVYFYKRAGDAPDLTLSQTVSPAQITSDQNDYNPAGLASASVLRLSTDSNGGSGRKLTGIASTIAGRVVSILNVGANPLALGNQDAASAAANRFQIGRTYTLQPNEAVLLQYDAADSRWKFLNHKSRPVGLFHVYRNTNQTGLIGGFNKLQFDTEAVDADGWYDNVTNYRYTPQEPGWYFFYCDAQILYGTAGASKEGVAAAVYKNGAAAVQGGPMLVMTSATIDLGTANCCGLVQMNGSTDYVEFQVYCGVGSGTSATNGTSVRNFAGGWKVADR